MPKTELKFPFSKYQVGVVLLLALTQFSVVLDFMVMSPLGDMLMKQLKLQPSEFGIVVSAYAFSAGTSGLLTAGFADKFDRKKLLLFFYSGFIIGTLFCALSDSFVTLVLARIFTGIFGGVLGSVSLAIVADLFTIEQRGRVMGFIQMGFGASQVMGIPISLFIANHYNWQAPFHMIVILAVVIWASVLLFLKPVNEHLKIKNDNNAFTHLTKTLLNKNYRIGYFATALLSLGGFMMMPYGSAFAINNLGVSEEELPLLFMIGGVVTLAIMPFVGKLSDRFNKFHMLTAASLLLIVVVNIYTNLFDIPFWSVVLINAFMMIGIMSRMVPAMALVSALPEMKDRGAFMSINSSLQQIAGGLAAGLGGLIVKQQTEFSPLENYNIIAIVVSVLTMICVFAIFRVYQIVNKQNT